MIVSGNDFESKFIRTCPVGVKSCFGAKGFYDRDDQKVSNDICKFKHYQHMLEVFLKIICRNILGG